MPTVSTNATSGENRRGKKTPLPNAANFTWENPTAVTPAPTSAPAIEWVVDMGRPNLAARSTVAPAPSATAVRNGRWLTTALSTICAPLNFAATARKVVQRVFRDGVPEQQLALIKDELARYAKKLHGYKRGWRHVVEVFGVSFPSEVRSLILSTGDVPNPQPSETVATISIEQGKAFLAMLDETAKKGDGALEALVTGYEWAS